MVPNRAKHLIFSLVRNFFYLCVSYCRIFDQENISETASNALLLNKLASNKHLLQLHLKRDHNNGHRALFHIKIQFALRPMILPPSWLLHCLTDHCSSQCADSFFNVLPKIEATLTS